MVFGLSGAALAVWAALHLSEAELPVAAVFGLGGLTFLSVAGLAWRLLRGGAVALTWDGRQWLAGGEPRQVGLMLQTSPFLLLRLQAAPRRTTWLAVERGEAGPAWHGLLVALHATPVAEPHLAEGQGG